MGGIIFVTRKLLSEPEGYLILDKAGVPVPAHSLARTPDEAAKAAQSIGFPVVMKIVSPDVVHKSDVNGVVVGIKSKDEAKDAFNSIIRSVKEKIPDANITGIILEKQMPSGLELLIGGKTDATFGKVITFGLGGKMVELMKDVSIKVLPIGEDEIRSMIQEISGYVLVKGYRGELPKDEAALIETLSKICNYFYKNNSLVEFDINPMILYEKGACAVDARLYVDDEAEERKETRKKPFSNDIFYPESIAVVGASAEPNKVGYGVFRNLLDFPGKLYPVNPKRSEILGHKAYPSLSEIPEKVDMMVVTVPGAMVPYVMEEAGQKGVKLAVVISAGFREIGENGRELEDRVVETAEKYGIRMVGPNCLGIILPHKKINATFDPISPQQGHLAFMSQSGAMITTVVDWSRQEDIGFSAIVSVGNQADMSFNEYLKFAAEDPDTRSIILYIEQIRDGRGFMDVVKDVSGKKCIVAIKSGSSKIGQLAASSHTGSLAGSHEVYMAAFRQTGIIVAKSMREAFQIAELLAYEDRPRGNRAIIITNAGGFAVLSSDYADRYGLELPTLPPALLEQMNSFLPEEWSHKNPMDMVGDSGADRYARVFDIMIRNQDFWDIAFVVAVPTVVLDPRALGREIVRFSRNTRNKVVGCILGGASMRSGVSILRESSINNFAELEEAFKAVGKVLGLKGKQDVRL